MVYTLKHSKQDVLKFMEELDFSQHAENAQLEKMQKEEYQKLLQRIKDEDHSDNEEILEK